ncbi:MAG: PilW family protein [Rhodocyclaceae bacterium]|nr:PilW family protein [Rhodocyclaceae bacterium]
MFQVAQRLRQRQSGFSLVEIMVAAVIGMFGVIVMMQVFALSEERKRTTTGGGDAMTEGVTALYALQRDIRQSGYGIADVKVLGCSVQLRTGVTLSAMAPVTIYPSGMANPLIPAGDANTDTLLVVYGNTNGSPQGDGITSQPLQTQYAVQTSTAFIANDVVVAAPSTRAGLCALTLDRVAGVVNPNVNVGTGVSGMSNGTLFNLGQAPTVVAYAIRNGNLTMCDYTANDCSAAANAAPLNPAVWVPIANNIVSLRAQYGRDTTAPSMDGIMDVFDQTTPTTACGWARASAVRLVLVARNAQFEKTAVTTAAPVWDGSAADNPPGSTAAAIDLSANATWQNYRYKVFQTVVPLRNIAWLGAVSGC